jgi:3-oxoacyl-[acyl-carrier-protein] synthase II
VTTGKGKRAVITGIGAVTPLGCSFKESLKGVFEGKSGLGICSKPLLNELPWRTVGEVKGFSPEGLLGKKEIVRLGLFVQYSLVAVQEALEDAGLSPPPDTLVIVGTSRGGIYEIERALLQQRRLSPYLMPATTHNMAASAISERWRISGPSHTLSSACASGAVAVGEAYRAIKSSQTKVAICGGTEAPITRVCLEGYGRMGAISKAADPKASRPFDKRRDGFLLSEGACMMVIEELEHALRRGAKVYAEIVGYATLTMVKRQIEPVVEAEEEVIRQALEDASLTRSDIDHINCHGTSTRLGDSVEASALERVFGRRLSQIPLTAIKSMTGHMLAGSSAFEVGVTAVSLRDGIIPPTINTEEPEFMLNISNIKRTEDIQSALTTSFGFGGVNAAVVLSRISS